MALNKGSWDPKPRVSDIKDTNLKSLIDKAPPTAESTNRIIFLNVRNSLSNAIYPRPLINTPPRLDREYNRDLDTKALKRKSFLNHGSTLRVQCFFWSFHGSRFAKEVP